MKFKIRLLRDVTEFVDVEIEAETREEAEDKALSDVECVNARPEWEDCDGNEYEPWVDDIRFTKKRR